MSKPPLGQFQALAENLAASSLALAIIAGVAVLPNSASQASPSPKASPSVSILLPPDIPSESVQIAYYLVGPFGGSRSYTDKKEGLQAYEIPTSEPSEMIELNQSLERETGRKAGSGPATQIKIIVYAPGCEIETFDLPLTPDSRVEEQFDCQPVAMVPLSGQIEPEELVRGKKAELIVTYEATWSYKFFNIKDGADTDFQLASVSPDVDGKFQVDLPYFKIDAEQSSPEYAASFSLTLRDPETWNPIANDLEPASPEYMTEEHTLRVQPYYPTNLKFIETPSLPKQ